MTSLAVVTPTPRLSASLAIAAARAGRMGLLDLGDLSDEAAARQEIARLVKYVGESFHWGFRVEWDALDRWRKLTDATIGREAPFLLIGGRLPSGDALRPLSSDLHARAARIFVEVTDAESAQLAQIAGADGLVLKGSESAGLVAATTSLELLLQVRGKVEIPFWLQGGVGPETASAAELAGCDGVLLREQLWLATESPFTRDERGAWTNLDADPTRLLTDDGHERRVASADPTFDLGQDILLASGLAKRFVNTAGILKAFARRIETSVADAVSAELCGLIPQGKNVALAIPSASHGFLAWQRAIDEVADRKTPVSPDEAVTVEAECFTVAAMAAVATAGVVPLKSPLAVLGAAGTDDGLAHARRTLTEAHERRTQPSPTRGGKSEDIAIVGMACVFPKAEDLRAYWENIVNRVDAVTEVPEDRWRASDFFDEDRFAPDRVYSKWGGFLGKMVFDPVKWRIPPASLKSIEPIQLLSLEIAARAMADAGYDRRDFPREKTGCLFATAGSHDLGSAYAFRTMMRHYLPKVEGLADEAREQILASLEEKLPEWTEDSFPGFLMNVVAGRIAREFNINGPNYTVDAACAASLAALHAAIEQLRTRTSDMMIVGAADATNNPFCFMSFSKTHALSPRGHSFPFDDNGDGIALGEGIGVVILKRLPDAQRDGDKIYAVIKGIGSSSDGKNKSLTAPYPPGQVKAVVRAYEDAHISPASVSLVEAHGTGTAVGDSAEITTLTQVFSDHSPDHQFCAVGSVKSMIGHTKTVAGIASLIKTALALKHGVLAPTIGVENPSRKIEFAKSPFYLNTETRPWLNELGDHPLRAGVSAFGFGGTNFHVVMEEYLGDFHPDHSIDFCPRAVEIFTWTAADKGLILDQVETIAKRLADVPTVSLASLARSVQWERSLAPPATGKRLAIVASSIDDLRQKLEKAKTLLANRESVNDPTGIYYSEAAPVDPKSVCYLYPGQGSQSVNMLRDLVTSCRWSHRLFNQANDLLDDFLPHSLSRYIYPPPAFSEAERKWQFTSLSDTRVAQPALGVVELFATDLLERFGLAPGMVAGHSYGEHVALYAAGVITREELLCLSATRGHVCAEVALETPGGMAAVRADAETTRMALDDLKLPLHLANLNAPDQTIIAGEQELIDSAVEELTKNGIKSTRIPVSAPFHTPLLHAGSESMAHHFANASFQKPRIPVYSNTTGEAHSDEPDRIRDLLARHFSEPVLFEKQIKRMSADGARVFIEVGPGKVLSGLVSRILKDEGAITLSLDAPGRDGWSQFGHLLAQSISLGLTVNLDAWFEGRGLDSVSVEDTLATAKRRSTPKPSDWLIGPSGAEPVTPLPTRRKGPARPGPTKSPAPSPAATPEAPVSVAPSHHDHPTGNGSTNGVKIAPATNGEASKPHGASRMDRLGSAPPPDSPPSSPSPSLVAVQSSGSIATTAPISAVMSGRAGPPPALRLPPPPRGLAKPPVKNAQSMATSSPTSSVISGHLVQDARKAMSNPGAELFAQFQATTRMMLDLQQSQQRILERFLDTQERVLFYCSTGGLPVGVDQAVTAIAAESAPIATSTINIPAPEAVAAPVAPRVATPAPAAAPKAPISMPSVPAPATAQATRPAPPLAPATPHSATSNGSAVAKPIAPAPKASPAPAQAPASSADGPPTTEKFKEDLLVIVSERTGYPVDMLDVELPLEAGLGIDSIKTVEIFSNLKEYHKFFNDAGQDEEELLAEFTKLKTLKDIIDSYDRRRAAGVGSGAAVQSNGSASSGHKSPSNGDVERFSVTATEAAAGGAKKNSLSVS